MNGNTNTQTDNTKTQYNSSSTPSNGGRGTVLLQWELTRYI